MFHEDKLSEKRHGWSGLGLQMKTPRRWLERAEHQLGRGWELWANQALSLWTAVCPFSAWPTSEKHRNHQQPLFFEEKTSLKTHNFGLCANGCSSSAYFLKSHSSALYIVTPLLGMVKAPRITCMCFYLLTEMQWSFFSVLPAHPNPFPVATIPLRISKITEEKDSQSALSGLEKRNII